MKKDRLYSYESDNFYPGRSIYRGNKLDNEILKRNIGKEVPVHIGNWDDTAKKCLGWSRVNITPIKFLNYDDRHENFIPDDEKAYSKKHGKRVPNRFAWEIETL